MSADPSSFNFDTGLSNISLDQSAMNLSDPTGASLGTNDPMGPLTEADLAPSSPSYMGAPSTPTLAPVNVSSYNLDSNQILNSLGGNPFANSNGGAPLTQTSPQMQPMPSGVSALDSQLQSELSGAQASMAPQPSAPASPAGAGLNFSNLLDMGSLAALGAYGLSQAKSAQSETASELQPLFNESNTMLGESKNLLDQYNAGKLPSWAQTIFNQTNGEGQSLINSYKNGTLPASEQNYANELNSTGSNLINQYKSGNLPQWAKSYVDWTSQQATDLINAQPTKALEQLATQNFTDYNSGKLKPADEMALSQQTASQKARVASMLGAAGDADSSVLAAQFQQIDNNATIQRQNVLNSYFQTGDTAYNSWINTNMQAAQIKSLGAQFANNVFANMLNEGLQAQEFAANYTATNLNAELTAGTQLTEYSGTFEQNTFNQMLNGAYQGATIGDQALTQAVGMKLQSDNELSSMVGSLMQSIATAFSYSAYQRANGLGGYSGYGSGPQSGGGTGSLVGSVVGNIERYGGAAWQGASRLLGFNSADGAAVAGKALGALGAAYSAYSTIKNWQSGNTASDAENAAMTGASVGAMFGPVGFVVGGVIGGAVGAISSAFGGGRNDPETLNWDNIAPQLSQNPSMVNQMTPSQVVQSLAGLMDAKNNSVGHSSNLELKFGRMGEGSVVQSMTSWINQAIRSGHISAQSDPSSLYNSVVKPHLQQMGAYVNSNDIVTKNGTRAGGAVDALLTRLIGLWQAGNLNSSTPVGISGQTIGGLPQYGA